MMSGSVAAMGPSTSRTLSNSSSVGGRMLARLLTSVGSMQVEHREVLHVQHFIHAFDAEAALAVEEVGDVGLLEAGLLRQADSGELAFFNAVPERFAQIILQSLEFHAKSIAPAYSDGILTSEVQHLKGNRVLDISGFELYAMRH